MMDETVLAALISKSGGGNVTPEQIQTAVNAYLQENPVTANIPTDAHGTSDTTFELTPNVFHTWGEVTSLDLTLGSEMEGVVNEYMFSFISGATATQLTLPATVNGVPAIEPNSIYQCSVIDNCFAYGRWDNNVTV